MYQTKEFQIYDFVQAVGITNGTRWNGWECPLFNLEESIKIIEGQISKSECLENGCTYYEISSDGLQIISTCEDGIFAEDSILVDNIRYYPIGYMNWVWEEIKINKQN